MNKKIPKKGRKFDTGKPDLTLLPYEVLEECAKVLMYGASKYDRWDWVGGLEYSRVGAGALRHYYKFMDKRETLDFDPDCKGCAVNDCDNHSNRHHIAASIVGLMFLLSYDLNGRKDLDNRRPKRK